MNVTAMVGLAGQLCGVITVRCHETTAVLMASKMLGLPIEKVGQDFPDALGEVCNMVAGNFKNKIGGLSDKCMLSPPSVITGSNYSLHSMANSPSMRSECFLKTFLSLFAFRYTAKDSTALFHRKTPRRSQTRAGTGPSTADTSS